MSPSPERDIATKKEDTMREREHLRREQPHWCGLCKCNQRPSPRVPWSRNTTAVIANQMQNHHSRHTVMEGHRDIERTRTVATEAPWVAVTDATTIAWSSKNTGHHHTRAEGPSRQREHNATRSRLCHCRNSKSAWEEDKVVPPPSRQKTDPQHCKSRTWQHRRDDLGMAENRFISLTNATTKAPPWQPRMRMQIAVVEEIQEQVQIGGYLRFHLSICLIKHHEAIIVEKRMNNTRGKNWSFVKNTKRDKCWYKTHYRWNQIGINQLDLGFEKLTREINTKLEIFQMKSSQFAHGF